MLKFFVFIVALVLIWHFSTRKFINPYKLYMVIGKKGSGKSTMLVRLAYQHLRSGWTVYTTDYLPGCFHVDYKDIGFFDLPAGSVLLVDEVGMVWDNRKYKTFPDELRDWFKFQRHEGVKVYLFSQTFDVDKKIRDLVDNMYLVENKARVFAYAKRILKKPCLVKPASDGPARLDEELKFDSLFWFWCGSRMITFIPRYAGLFDSHCRLGLPYKDYEYIQPLNVPYSLLRKKGRRRSRRGFFVRLRRLLDKRVILLRSFFRRKG